MSVSVGLNDRVFVVPDFKAEHFVWSMFNRVTLNYLVHSEDTDSDLVRVDSPHLTFHPPHWFHLTVKGKKEAPFQAIGEVSLMLRQDGVVPWVRFVSKPVFQLPITGVPRHNEHTKFLDVNLSSDKCSIGLAVDFESSDVRPSIEGALVDTFLPWGINFLRVYAVELPPQKATMSWYHQH